MDPDYDPTFFSPEAQALIEGLLQRDPKRRLGKNGAAEIKAMAFFDSMDWARLELKELVSPFSPGRDIINAESQSHIGDFDGEDLKVSTGESRCSMMEKDPHHNL